MEFMIIEQFRPGKLKEIYRRFEEKGRMLPEGVYYLNSWIDAELRTCYQLMEAGSVSQVEEWTRRWNDLAEFRVVPVISSEMAKKIALEE